MACTITLLTAHPDTVASPYDWALVLEEGVEVGAFLVLLGMQRAQSSPATTLSPMLDSADNSYPLAYFLNTSGGRPLTWIALGRVHRPLVAGDFFIGPQYPELVQAYRLDGADSWVPEGAAQADGDPGGTGGPHSTWSLPELAAPASQRERILVGVLGAGHAAPADPAVDGGSVYGAPTALDHTDGSEHWSCLHLTASLFADEPAAHAVTGTFGTASQYWTGAHVGLRPVVRGRGNRLDAARGLAGRLLTANGYSVPNSAGGTGVGATALTGSASLVAHRDGRWTLLGSGANAASPPDLGYTTRLYTSRDQGGTWSATTLHDFAQPASETPGYQAAVHAASPRTGNLILLAHEHRARQWWVQRGLASGAGWSWTDLTLLAEETAPYGDAAWLPDGRLYLAWLTAGTVERLYTATSPIALTEEPVRAGQALLFLEARQVPPTEGWTAAGAAAETLLEADLPYDDDGVRVVTTWDGLRLLPLPDGRLLVLLHEVVWRLAPEGTVTYTRTTILRSMRRSGETWVTEALVEPATSNTYADAALLRRRDAILELHYRTSAGSYALRRCRRLGLLTPWA